MNATVRELLAKLDELERAIEGMETVARIEKEARLLDWRRGIEIREQQAASWERIAKTVEAMGPVTLRIESERKV